MAESLAVLQLGCAPGCSLTGVSAGRRGSELLVSVQGDGVVLFDVEEEVRSRRSHRVQPAMPSPLRLSGLSLLRGTRALRVNPCLTRPRSVACAAGPCAATGSWRAPPSSTPPAGDSSPRFALSLIHI